MKIDAFDKILWLLLSVVLVALALLLWQGAHHEGASGKNVASRAMERELTYQARISLLQKIYGPVEELRRKGELQSALLKLDELARTYPGEAHGYILQAEILQQLGVKEAALSNYVAGVRLDGDYIDKNSPLSRRDEISRFVTEAEGTFGGKAAADSSSSTLVAARKDLNYLKSRLAGGCE